MYSMITKTGSERNSPSKGLKPWNCTSQRAKRFYLLCKVFDTLNVSRTVSRFLLDIAVAYVRRADCNSKDYVFSVLLLLKMRIGRKEWWRLLLRYSPLSVQQPRRVTMLGWGLRLFMTCNSLSKSCLSLSPADSFSVFTATKDGPSWPKWQETMD